MKKLMVLGLAMASAMVVSASNFRWDAEAGFLKNGNGDDSDNIEANATAYLFDSGTFTQQALLTALQSGSLADVWAESGVTAAPKIDIDTTDGKFLQSEKFVYGTAGTDYTFYTAIIAKDMDGYVFISDLADPARATGLDTPTDVSMNSLSNPSKERFTSTTFTDAGWYQTVPEPTSGLLLLIGVAGLALRRRRA